MIAKLTNQHPPEPDRAFCGASIIAPQLLLTAAHCLLDKKSNVPSSHWLERRVIARVGTSEWKNKQPPSTSVLVEDFEWHSGYKKYGYNATVRYHAENDIAVVLLKRPLELHPADWINAICLPPRTLVDYSGVVFDIMGYGRWKNEYEEGDQVKPDRMQWATVTNTYTDRYDIIDVTFPDEEITPGQDHNHTSDYPSTCKGDSGGALAYMYDKWNGDPSNPYRDKFYTHLAGITSGGSSPFHCGGPGSWSYYTKVSYFRDWIDKAIVRLFKRNVIQRR